MLTHGGWWVREFGKGISDGNGHLGGSRGHGSCSFLGVNKIIVGPLTC